MCGGAVPDGIECRVEGTKQSFAEAGVSLHVPCQQSRGLLCLNANQTNNRTCPDFEVRYKCSVKKGDRDAFHSEITRWLWTTNIYVFNDFFLLLGLNEIH